MRRVFGVVALVCFTMSARATSTVTGTFVDGHGTAVTSRAYGLFELKGCNGNIPRVTASGVVVPPSVKVTPDGSGMFSQALYKTSEIDCGGQTSVTTWDFSAYYDGRKLYTYNFTINTASFDVNSATPNTASPTITAPTGDSTYLRLDGGNQYQGSFVPSANNLYNLGSSGARWANVYSVLGNFSGTITGAGANFTALTSTSGALNGTIGATTPLAGTFTTVTANTSVTSAAFISSANASTQFTTSSRDITLTTADGSGANHGGNINLTTGAAGSTNGAGAFILTGGLGNTGSGGLTAFGGYFQFTGGNGFGGGGFAVTTGNGLASGIGSRGGAVAFITGNATGGNNSGGPVSFTLGNGNGSGASGTFTVTGGTAGATGSGGDISLFSGAGGASSGSGGNIAITAGNATAGASDGGSITLTPGDKSGAGSNGAINLASRVRINGGTLITGHQSATASLDYDLSAAGITCQDIDITGFSSITNGDTVAVGIPVALASTAGVTFSWWVKDASTVTVRGCDVTSGNPNPAAATVRADVWQHN